MQQLRGFTRSDRRGILFSLALGAPLLASACTIASMPTLTGVGCADPSCNEVMPETRKVIHCDGEVCNESPPPRPTQPVGASADGESSDRPHPAAAPETDSAAAPEDEKTEDGFSLGGVKIYYESLERGPARSPDDR